MKKINGWNDKSDRQHRRSCRRENVQNLEFFRVRGVPTRHSLITKDELREECKVESNKNQHSRDFAPKFGVHLSGDLWPPVVKSAHIRDYLAANHHVMKVSHDEISVSQMHRQADRPEEQPCQPADQEQSH